jgi:23S rRNA pseudouridine1911/1915/1917 synthase
VPTPSAAVETFVVAAHEGGLRLDRFLVARIPRWSRRQSHAAIAAGAVLVNRRRGRKGDMVRPGDVVDARLGDFIGDLVGQSDVPLAILYEDDALVVVDKPAGVPAVALRPGDRGTIANALIARYPELAGVGRPFEAGLVHRLDTPTSGVLAAARSQSDWQGLRAQFSARRVGKLYVAAVGGAVTQSGAISIPIGHRPGDPRTMVVAAESSHPGRARQAITRYRPVQRWGDGTLLAVTIPTGVRHQIRVHLASIGHPVLGDPLYADQTSANAAPRLMLHAARLTFVHPRTGNRLRVRSPLPDDVRSALRQLTER